MLQPKKVAIIGAGPAGLVTAKTLLHNFPAGTFAPTVLEKRSEIGGLWPSSNHQSAVESRGVVGGNRSCANGSASGSAGPVNPFMWTNLSRFTVAFSDLAWESVLGDKDVPMFPRAWQVGLYLEQYAERYVPAGVVRLGCEVLRTVRGQLGWRVDWRESKDKCARGQSPGKVISEQFDYLVVASGYFSTPYIPEIPGLSDFKDRTIHSSVLDNPQIINDMLPDSGTEKSGKLLVVGGSMSGAEAASALAFHLSSEKHTPSPSPLKDSSYEVHHICSKPFWTLPTYLPQTAEGTDESVSFLPLDLVLYNLDRRPPGQVEYTFGPLSREQIARTNNAFRSILGSEYEIHGHIDCPDKKELETPKPTFVAIGNDYAEFVRSKAILPTVGRVYAVNHFPSGLASVDIKLPDGQITTLDNVAAIIPATGYTPHKSLSFLSDEVLSVLEYQHTDSYLPLILDGKGSARAEIPNIGFVGFYKGPYWGAMEMQARLLGQKWTTHGNRLETELAERREERNALRAFRNADPDLYRAQLPMGDYTGLMESFARDLGIDRAGITATAEGRGGPVIPARYAYPSNDNKRREQTETEITLDALRNTLNPTTTTAAPGTAIAIFSALHGSWSFNRTYTYTYRSQPGQNQRTESGGKATFHPRAATKRGYEKEYFYRERRIGSSSAHSSPAEPGDRSSAVYKLLDPLPREDGVYIHVCAEDGNADSPSHGLRIGLPRKREREGQGDYIVSGTGTAAGPGRSVGAEGRYEYLFYLDGVAVRAWERRAVYGDEGRQDGLEIRTLFER